MRINHRRGIVAYLFASMLLTACGGSGTSSTAMLPSSHSPSSVTLTLRVPPITKQATIRRPKYVSPSTQGFAIVIGPSTTTSFTTTQEYAPTAAFDLTVACTTSNNCTVLSDGSHSFTVTLQVAPGSYTLDLIAFDQKPTSVTTPTFPINAAELSKTIIPLTLSPGSAGNALSFTLNGITQHLAFTPSAGQTHVVSDGKGYDIIGNGPTNWVLVPLDADGSIITGPGAPTLSVSDPGGTYSIHTTGTNSYTVAANTYSATSIPVSVSASAPSGSGILPISDSVMLTTVQELWTAQNAGSAPNGIMGYPLYPPSYTPVGVLDSIPDFVGNRFCSASNANSSCNLDTFALDDGGNVVVVSGTSQTAYVFNAPTAATSPSYAGTSIGPISSANYHTPAIDSSGNIYLPDSINNDVLIFAPTNFTTPQATTGSVALSGANDVIIAPNGAGIPSSLQGSMWVSYSGMGSGPVTGIAAFAKYSGSTPSQIPLVGAPPTSISAIAFDALGRLWASDGLYLYLFNVSGSSTSVTLTSIATPLAVSQSLGGNGFGVTGNGTAWIANGFGIMSFQSFTTTPQNCISSCTLTAGATLPISAGSFDSYVTP